MCRRIIFTVFFMLAPGIANVTSAATDPYPPDGTVQSQTWVFLTWTPGAAAVSYDVYLGDNLDEVENAVRSGDTYQGNQIQMFFIAGFSGYAYPEGLLSGSTYYWRIDEVWADGTVYKGTVWNFKITPDTGWIPFIPEAVPGAVHDVKLKASDNTGIAIDSDIPGMHIVNVTVDGQVYQRISMPSVHYTTAAGKPKVPAIRRYLEIPYDVNYLTVEILYADPAILTGYNIYPAQQPLEDLKTSEQAGFVKDDVTYLKDELYPSEIAEVAGPFIMRGHRIVPLIIFPVQFNPARKLLRVYSKIEVRVNYDRPLQIEGIEDRLESEAFESLCEAFILNYKPPSRYLTRRNIHVGSPSADYLIITHDNFETEIKPLAQWKEKKGLKTKIVKTSDISSPVAPTAADITTYIQNAYNTWNPPPTYVLLVGDSDFIPTHYRTAHPSDSHGGNATATDLYYATVDGTDRFADILIGRISVDTAAETDTIVDKILDYEKNPPTNAAFYNDISMCAFFQDTDLAATAFINESDGFEDRRFVLTSEEIRGFLDRAPQNYNVERIYNTDSQNVDPWGNYVGPTNYNNGDYDAGVPLPAGLLFANGFLWNGDTADVTAAFNAGRFIISHRDHGLSQNYWDERPAAAGGQWQGNFDGWGDPFFSTFDIPGLNNINELPVVFSMNCQTGWFDGETDPYAWNSECFCEELLRYQNGGAVAAFGATRNSYSGYNDDLVRGFIDAVWPDFDGTMTTGAMFQLGQILVYGKVHMAVTPKPLWGTAMHELTAFEEFLLFGDPEMWIWTEQPKALTVKHPPVIGSGGPQKFVVTVIDYKNVPVHHAAVCLFKDSDIHTAGYTNPEGQVIFDVSPSSAGNMDITVTAHNHLPYEDTIVVTDNGATISVSPGVGHPGASFTVNGADFDGTETVAIDLGGTLVGSASASGGSFSDSFTVPVIPDGPNNVTAIGQTSNRTAVALYKVLQTITDPYTYSQFDSSTWHINPSGYNPVWDSPSIRLKEQSTGLVVSSTNLTIGTPYIIEATVYNAMAVQTNGVTVSFKHSGWGAGQRVWNLIGTDTVDLPQATVAPTAAIANTVWTPMTTGHICILAEIDHPWDANINNNIGQENTDVHPITSPGEVTFDVFNPTDARALVYLEVTQNDPFETGELWGTRIQREYPQVLEPGERQTATLEILAPDDVETGESRTITVTATIGGQIIGGVEIQVIKDHPPVLTNEYYDPNIAVAGAGFTYWVTYTDKDNHSPLEGYPALSVFKAGVPIAGSPFAMEAEDPNDSNYSDGKTYVCTVVLPESGNDYTHSFQARDSLGIGAEGPATIIMPGPVVERATGDLLAYYTFEKSVFDSSGNSLNGTMFGGPEFVAGVAGMGLQLDGVDDYVDFGNDPLFDISGQITLSLWVKTQDIGSGQNNPWLGKGDTAYMIKGHRTGNQIEFFIYDGGWNVAHADVGPDFNGRWHHVAATFDGERLIIYVDGEMMVTSDYTGGIGLNTYNVALGTNTQVGGRFSEGIFDEVMIYNRALSAEEISNLVSLK